MQRREFLRWLCRVTGGLVAVGVVSELPPLRKINATLFSAKAHATSCIEDGCTVQDSCAGKDYCSTLDACQADVTGYCQTDKCKLDYQNGESDVFCNNDICTLDKSGDCNVDLCRIDMTSGCTNSDVCATDNCSDGDTCSADGASCPSDEPCVLEICGSGDICVGDDSQCTLEISSTAGPADNLTRRDFAKTGINKALKILYRFCTVVLFAGLAYGHSQAATVIDARDAVFSPVPTFNTAQAMAIPANVGPFLRDCDNDGFIEADTNCDNVCAGDPEIGDYSNNGSYELPPGALFEGSCHFSCFFIPYNVSISATGPLTISTSNEIVVFGAMDLPGGGAFNAVQMIDLRTSAWNSGGPITFNTSLIGTVDTSQTPVPPGGQLPIPTHVGPCQDPLNQNPLGIPTLNEWGMIIFMLLAGAGAIYYVGRQRRAEK